MTQQARQLVWKLQEEGRAMRFLWHDRDAKFSTSFAVVFASERIEIILTPYHAPNANAYAERWVRSVREECLDHLLIVNERHLDAVLREYGQYHNQARPREAHWARDPRISKRSPRGRSSAAEGYPGWPYPRLLSSCGIEARRTWDWSFRTIRPFLVLLVLFLVFTASFILVEHASLHPLVPLSVFRIRNLLVANLLAASNLAIASIFGFTLTLYLQSVLGLTALVTGLIFIPAGLGGIVGGRFAPQIIRRAGLHSALVTGPALIVLGSALMARITPGDGALWVTLGYMLVGIGLGFAVVTLTIAVTNALGPEVQGLAAGLLNTSQQIGAALGASLASLVATSVALALGNHGKAAVTTGDQVVIYLAGALALLAGALAVLAIRPSSTKPTSSDQPTFRSLTGPLWSVSRRRLRVKLITWWCIGPHSAPSR